MRLGARGKAFNLLAQLKAAPVWAICDPHSFNYLFPPLPLALLPVLDHQTCTIIRNVVGPIGKLANANLSLILLIYIQSPATTKDCDCKHWNLPFHCPYWHHHCSCRKNILLQKKEIKGGKEKDVLAEKNIFIQTSTFEVGQNSKDLTHIWTFICICADQKWGSEFQSVATEKALLHSFLTCK